MSPKRIRCDCGRVYDPANHSACPDCGAPTQLVVEPPRVESPDEPTKRPVPAPPIVSPPPQPGINLALVIGGGALVLLVLLILLLVRPKGGQEKAKIDHGGTPSATATPGATTSATVHENSPPPYGFFPPAPFDLAAAIASAAPGATINIPAGFYRGGFVVRQPLHLVGQSNMGGMVMIQSEGRAALSIEAKDVLVSNLQITSQGIGQLPAISVAKGAELKLDSCTVQTGSEVGVTVGDGGQLQTVGANFSAARGIAVRLDSGAKGNFTQSAFSNSLVGLSLTTGASAELHGCAFENDGMDDVNGATVSLEGKKTQFTGDDCHYNNNTGAFNVANGAGLLMQNSAFKSNGGSSRGVVGLIVISHGGSARLTNTTFEQNRAGILVESGGRVEVVKCNFDQNGFAQPRGVAAGSLPLTVAGKGSSAVVRQSILSRSAPYAASVIAGGELRLESSEISGSSEIGLLVGERGAPGGDAEITGSHFLGNGVGLGVCAGGSATADGSEFRENNDGVVALDSNSELRLTKSKLKGNRTQGLHVFGGASASLFDCDLRGNQIGVLSGTRGKSNQRGAIALENCRFGGNRSFAAGAARESTLTLKDCAFDGTDKLNIFKERGAIVQENALPPPEPSTSPEEEEEESPAPSGSASPSPSPETSPSPGVSPSPTISPTPTPTPSPTPHHPRPRTRPTPTPRLHPPTPDDIRRALKKLLPGG